MRLHEACLIVDRARQHRFLAGQTFYEALLLLNELFLFLFFFALGAELINSTDEGIVHFLPTLFNTCLDVCRILQYYLPLAGVRQLSHIHFRRHNETVILDALGSLFRRVLDLDSGFIGVLLLAGSTFETGVVAGEFSEDLPLDSIQVLVGCGRPDGIPLVASIAGLGVHARLDCLLALLFV